MKTKLNDDELAALLPKIKTALETGKEWVDENLHYPAGAIIDAVQCIEGVEIDRDSDAPQGFGTNGWEWDWWQAFTYQGKKYTLSGSGYYGGHRFGLSDE
jgi:hypothetical protein